MTSIQLPASPRPIKSALVSPIFADGRVVSAEDLHLAMTYPLDVFRVMMRAFFGCGIVCGLELVRDPRLDKLPKEHRRTDTVRVLPGVALDCHGHPIQLCGAVDVDPVVVDVVIPVVVAADVDVPVVVPDIVPDVLELEAVVVAEVATAEVASQEPPRSRQAGRVKAAPRTITSTL